MEFRYDFSDGRSDMIYDSVEGESLDVLTVRMIRETDGPSCLLKMEVEEREWGYSFRYDISGVTNMMAWQEMVVPEEKEAMIQKIQRAVTELKQWYIPREELVLEQQYLYVDDMTGEVRLLCIPLKRESSSVQMPSAGLQSEIPPVTTIPPIPPQQEVPPVESLPPIPPTPDDFDLFGEIEETGKKRKGFWERKREKKAARKRGETGKYCAAGKTGNAGRDTADSSRYSPCSGRNFFNSSCWAVRSGNDFSISGIYLSCISLCFGGAGGAHNAFESGRRRGNGTFKYAACSQCLSSARQNTGTIFNL